MTTFGSAGGKTKTGGAGGAAGIIFGLARARTVSENDTMLVARAWRGMLGSIARGHGTVVLSRDSNTVWILETGHRLHGPAGATV